MRSLTVAILCQIPLVKGAFDEYPFDHYECVIAVYVYTGPSYSTSSTELAVLVNKAISYGFTFTVGSFGGACAMVRVCVC
jgi:hypothetical protein